MAINLLDNINYTGHYPLDKRLTVSDLSELESKIADCYVGALIYCESDGKYYKITSIVNGGSYEEFNASSEIITITSGYTIGGIKAGDTITGTAIDILKRMLLADLISSINISCNKSSINIGETAQFTAVVNPSASASKISWIITEGSNYGSIDSSGVLTAEAEGTIKVKAVATDGSGVSSNVVSVISSKIAVTGVSITAPTSTIQAGDTLQFTANIIPTTATYKSVTWNIISGSSYATINSTTGLLTANSSIGSSSSVNVTVKAISVDNPTVSSTYTISIVPKSELYTYWGILTPTEFNSVNKTILETAKSNGYIQKETFSSITKSWTTQKESSASSSYKSYWIVCAPQSKLTGGSFSNYMAWDLIGLTSAALSEKTITIDNNTYKLAYISSIDPSYYGEGEGYQIKTK